MRQYRSAVLFAKLQQNKDHLVHRISEDDELNHGYSHNEEEFSVDIHEESESEFSPKNNIIDQYVKEIQKYPLLEKEEEREYLIRAKNDDVEARDHLIHANLRLVLRIARRYQRIEVAFLDLVAEGNFGLIHAIKKFDLSVDHRFSTYAAWWVQHYIESFLLNQSRLIRVPVHIQKKLSKMRKMEHKLVQTHQRQVSTLEVADAIGFKESDLDWFKILSEPILSFTPVYNDDNDHTMITVPATSQDEESTALEENIKFLVQLLDTLPELEREVVIRRIGLYDQPLFFHEIGDLLNIKKNRARNIYERAIVRLNKTVKQSRSASH